MKKIVAPALAALLLAACTQDAEPRQPTADRAPADTPASESPEPTESQVAPESNEELTIQTWFLDRDAKLALHHARIPRTQAVGRAALEALIAGVPDDAPRRTFSAVPKDTKILGLTISGGTAVVDFSRDFEDTGLGSAADGLQVAQVVYTLTQFPTVKRVEFRMEGEPVEVLGGHGIIIDGPQTRKDWHESLPPIVVESPYVDEATGTRFTMKGIANVFEATVSYRIVSTNGDVIQEGFTTASCGTGCWGTFSEKIRYKGRESYAVLQVFESSAEDGSPLHMVEVPFSTDGP